MPWKCILYPLPQIVFLSASNRLHTLTGSGRLLSVFILASRELPSIWDLSRMESRSTGMRSPAPAEHRATTALHSEAKSCRSPGKRVQIGQLLSCSPFPTATWPAGARVHSLVLAMQCHPYTIRVCWVGSPATASRSIPDWWCRAGSGQILLRVVCTHHCPSMHPVLPRGCSGNIATNAAFLKELQTATAVSWEWRGLCGLFLS